MAFIDLFKAAEVSATTDIAETHTPANLEIVSFHNFWGNSAHTPNAVISVIWDYEGTGEEILWSTKGTIEQEDISFIPPKTGDGTKKIALVLSNSSSGPLILSGRLTLEIG